MSDETNNGDPAWPYTDAWYAMRRQARDDNFKAMARNQMIDHLLLKYNVTREDLEPLVTPADMQLYAYKQGKRGEPLALPPGPEPAPPAQEPQAEHPAVVEAMRIIREHQRRR